MNRADGCRYVPGVAAKEVWWFEARRCGTIPLALPVATVALLWTLVPRSGLWEWLVGAGFALPVGLGAAAVAAGEPMTELQLTMPTALRSTMCRRFIVLLAPVLASAVLVVAAAAGELNRPALLLLLQMVAFVALLMAIAVWAAVTLRSLAGASTVVIVAWLATLFVVERLVTDPVTQAVALLAAAAPIFAQAMRRLTDGEHLIGKEAE